jgi:hypothetical protein
VSVDGIAAVARQLENEARARVAKLAEDARHDLQGIAAAFDLHNEKYWSVEAVIAVAGVLLRLMPEASPELACKVVETWQVGRGGVIEETDDIGEERGSA